MTAVTEDRGGYRLTFSRLAGSQARAFLDGAAAGWGLLAVLGLAVASGFAAGFVGLSTGREVDLLPGVNAALSFAAVGLHLYAIAVGSDAIAGEFARGTIRASLSVVPRRGLLFGAKALTVCGAVAAVGTLTGIAAGGSTLLIAALLGQPVGESTIVAWLVGTAGLALGAGVLTVGTAISAEAELPYWGALLVLAAWCALLVPVAVISFLRRDITTVSAARARTPQRTTARPAERRRTYRATAVGRLKSELRKSWSLSSVRWILAITTLLLLAYGMARSASGTLENRGRTPAEALSNEFAFAITDGVGGVALLLAALAAIQVAGEFETGTAVSTFLAAPRRWQVTASKLIAAALSSVAFALPGLVLTAVLAATIYAGRGHPPTAEMLASGALASAKALLFLLLTTVMSAGIAGLTRRSVPTILSAAFLLIIGPALLNTVRGFATAMGSPLASIGNAARFLPWEGARFYYSVDVPAAFAEIDSQGVLHVSASLGITITALWAIVAVAVWFVAEARRPITVR